MDILSHLNPATMAVGLAALALAGLLLAYLRARATGLPPWGQVVAVDAGGWKEAPRAYVSERLGLSGRPDYLVEQNGHLIPVEAKPTRGGRPRPWDLIQLGAYLLLVEEAEGKRPTYGVLAYRERAFRIVNTAGLRRRVLATLERLREARGQGRTSLRRERTRCRKCGYRRVCAEEKR